MKKYGKYLMILAAGALAACSSMAIDDDEIAQENFPADFSVKAYTELHPALVSLQVQDSVKMFNDASTLEKDAQTADFEKFKADTASVHKIYVNPLLMAKSEKDWSKLWEDIIDTVSKLDTTYKYDTVKVTFQDGGSLPVSLYKLTSIIADETGITAATGFEAADTVDMANPVTFKVSETVKWLEKKTQIDATPVKIDTVKTVKSTPGSLSTIEKDLKKFNFYGVENDVQVLDAITQNPDTVAIKQQYLIYGKKSGWAYRKCNESELSNPELTSVTEVKLGATYCDDNGLVREIK